MKLLACFLAGALAAAGPLAAAEPSRRFSLNERMIEDLGTTSDPAACDPKSVLIDLLTQLGPTANVYPTENYAYFQFYKGRKSYSGSLRFALDRRNQGIVDFVCYETYASWLEPDDSTDVYAQLSAKDGVMVTRAADLKYKVTIAGVATLFSLNNLDQSPNAAVLAANDRFVGRSFDESGLSFDIVYDHKQKAFFFVLDARGPVRDVFVEVSPKVFLGRRTGFVFYQDTSPDRLVLVAAHSEELFRNGWLDGPFDHLPENFYETNGFWEAVYDAYPDLKGRLTPGGQFVDNDMIFAVAPYRSYTSQTDLGFIKDCTERVAAADERIVCLTAPVDL